MPSPGSPCLAAEGSWITRITDELGQAGSEVGKDRR
jgi:hypothetical protein